MATNLDLNPKLLDLALKLNGEHRLRIWVPSRGRAVRVALLLQEKSQMGKPSENAKQDKTPEEAIQQAQEEFLRKSKELESTMGKAKKTIEDVSKKTIDLEQKQKANQSRMRNDETN